MVRQVSVFLENRQGRLEEVTKVLHDNRINILAMSLADTNDYGLLRLILAQPEKGKDALSKAGFSATLTQVIAVKLPNKEGTLYGVVKLLAEAGENIEYMYILDSSVENGSIIIKVPETQKVLGILDGAGVSYIDESSLSSER